MFVLLRINSYISIDDEGNIEMNVYLPLKFDFTYVFS